MGSLDAKNAASRVADKWFRDRLFVLYTLVFVAFLALGVTSVVFEMGIVAILTSIVVGIHYMLLAAARVRRVIQELIQDELVVVSFEQPHQNASTKRQVPISKTDIPVQEKLVQPTMYRFGGSQCPPPPSPEELDDRWDTEERDSGVFNI